MEYRGIQLDENMKLYRKNGEFNKAIKKALDSFVDALEERKFKCIGTYQGTHTPIKLQCDKEHEISVYPNGFKRGIGCKKCNGTDPEQAKEDLINLIKSNGHKLLSDYVNTATPVLIDFNCGHDPHEVTPHQYKGKKSGCPLCGRINSAEKRSVEAKAEFPSIVQSRGHKLLTEYERSNKKVLIDFNCGHDPHWIEPHAYKSQKGCPRCADMRGSVFRTAPFREEFPMFVESKGHILLTPYGKNSREKVLIDFKCGHEPHWITPHDYKSGCGCPKCGREKVNQLQKLKSEQAKEEFSLIVKSNNHILLSEYKSNHEKVLIDFKCEHGPHLISPAHYKNSKGCPKCGYASMAEKRSREASEEFPLLVKTNNHILLTPYGKNNIDKVLIDFKCGHEPHLITPSQYKQGSRCPKCSGHCPEQAKEEFYLLAEKEEYKIIGKYVNAGTSIKLQCKNGHYWSVDPSAFKSNGHRCRICRGLDPEQAKEDFYLEVKKAGYKLLGTYKGSHIKVKLQCDKGHFWNANPTTFKNGTRCRKCSGLDPEQTKEDFLKEVKANGHILLSEYGKNANDKVLIDFKCSHGPNWTTPHSYRIAKHKCIKCSYEAMGEKRSQESREAFPLLVQSNKHILLSDYGKNCYEKVLIDFKCGHEAHWIAPTSYKSGQGCPICSESKGEKIISEWLDQNNIKYQREYKLPNKRWRYDFYIPSENLIIEVQGVQHYKFVEYFHKTKENFYKQANDYNSKWAYARLKLGINFIEVNYKEGDPELALERFIKAYNEYRPIEEPEKQLSLL